MKKTILVLLFALIAIASNAQTLEVKDGKVQRKCTHPKHGNIYYESATPAEISEQITQTNMAIAMLKAAKDKSAAAAVTDLSSYVINLNTDLVAADKLDATIPKPEPVIDIIPDPAP